MQQNVTLWRGKLGKGRRSMHLKQPQCRLRIVTFRYAVGPQDGLWVLFPRRLRDS